MLSINLIPQYFFDRRAVKKLMIIFGIVFVVVIVGLIAYYMMLNSQIAKTEEEFQQVDVVARQVEGLETQAKGLRDEIAPIKTKITFINDVMKYNTSLIPLITELSRYTYGKITYTSVTPKGAADGVDSIEIKGWAPSITDAGRYLLNLYRASHLFSGIAFNGVPGYGTGAGGKNDVGAGLIQGLQIGFEFTATCTLKTEKQIKAPTYTGASAAPAAGGAPGAPGAAPGGPAGGPPPSKP